MDNSKLYEEIMLNTCFDRLKSIRNQWNENEEERQGLESIIDIGGADHRLYSFIMERCNSEIYEMILHIVVKLLECYEIPIQQYAINEKNAIVFAVNKNGNWPESIEHNQSRRVLAFSRKDQKTDILYVFKKYGIQYRLPDTLITTIKKEYNLKYNCYISIIEDDAFKEVLNHNDNQDDPSRGTGRFSLKQFFNSFFGLDEYEMFKNYSKIFAQRVQDYLGFSIVRTLKPNSIHNYRGIIKNNLLSFEISSMDMKGKITDEQKKVINRHFYENGNYKIMTGTSDFAKSFMTAEWLYDSLSEAENIDLTAIAMGYFKSIEQLLFKYLSLHTNEKDGKTRTVYAGKGKGQVLLDDKLVTDESKSKYLTLGSLTGFFGYYDNNKRVYYKRNQDLLCGEVNEDTYEYVIDVLNGIVGLRNGFFHKHNLEDWKKVVEAKNSAYTVFYLILGAYKITENDADKLGIIRSNQHDGFYKLCEYMNNRAKETHLLDIPIFYSSGECEAGEYCLLHEDTGIEYDVYGEPIYSGVCYARADDLHTKKTMTRDELPAEIWEGILRISRSVPPSFVPSGPLHKVFETGRFIEQK